MRILIVAATTLEIDPFLKRLRAGELHRDIDVLITGVGLTAATYAITRQVATKKPAYILQAGIAGCFDPRFPLGQVVAVSHDMVGDLGVIEKGTMQTMFDLGLIKANRSPHTNGWMKNRSALLPQAKLKKVKAISVNTISTDKKRIRLYRERFNPVVESMEGAALHYVAIREHIPFLQLRAISNYVGERNKKKWMIRESVENLNNELIKLLALL